MERRSSRDRGGEGLGESSESKERDGVTYSDTRIGYTMNDRDIHVADEILLLSDKVFCLFLSHQIASEYCHLLDDS